MLFSLFLIFGVQLLLDSLQEGIKKNQEHEKENKVRKMAITVRSLEDVLEKEADFHFYELFIIQL